MRAANFVFLLFALLTLSLGGCDLIQGEDPEKVAAAREADGKAIGAACRQTGRALEDCYVMNPRALRSAMYAGWLDMDAYMRDNKIPIAVPDLVEPPVGGKAAGNDTAKKSAAEPKQKAAAKGGA